MGPHASAGRSDGTGTADIRHGPTSGTVRRFPVVPTVGIRHDRRLDAREQEIHDLLGRAVGAMGAVRSGLGHSLHRWLRTGELTRSYLSLARGDQVKATGDPSVHWSALVAAGELLAVGPDGGEREGLAQARAHCRGMAAKHGAARHSAARHSAARHSAARQPDEPAE
ncbi:hypothetical protein [Streptomyces sp. NPDC057690]|uniref:hypothetical protein n=1 Tax=Streptomyces sp. NPDC057690 TaxID=3346214 RepID=UPI0036B2D194